MKKLLFLLLIPFFAISCNNTEKSVSTFNVNGTVSGLDSGMIVLNHIVAGEFVSLDSMTSTDGKFSFTGSVDFPELYYIFLGDEKHQLRLFIENSPIEITVQIDSLDNAKITGSTSNDEYNEYNLEMLSFRNKSRDLYAQYNEANEANDTTLVKEVEANYDALMEERSTFVKNFITEKKSSAVSPYVIRRELVHSLDASGLDSVLNVLDTALNASVYVKEIRERISILKNVEIGQIAPDFELADTTGKMIAISSFKGNYLLIDFWAAWCSPCRRENPNNVKLYAKYHDKGFEILGVSFDEKREDWIGAIQQDGLTWPQISDLKGWKSAAGKLYGVNSIPHTVLLDPEGKIIAKNLRGDGFREKLEEIFGE